MEITKNCFIVSCLLIGLSVTDAALGLDLASSYSSSTFSCLTNNGYSFMIIRAYHSYGAVDTNAPPTVAAAHAGGIKYVDVYMFPCYGKNSTLPASQQMSDLVNYLKQNNVDYGMIWYDIEENPSTGCGWETSSSKFPLNCQFLSELIAQGKAMGVSLGAYSSSYEWSIIMGNCTTASSLPLWYPHWDGKFTFSDFTPFGGWTAPAIKQYSDGTSICGLNEDGDWYP